MPLEPTSNGLLARAGDYEPLRAFSQGGVYWDKVPQQLIRESSLAEFLPPVEVEKDDRGKYGRFHYEQGRRELLSRSKPLGGGRIPADQLQRLKQAIEEFKARGRESGAQEHNRQLIERFRLPNPGLEPELYRLVGSWWNRRLQILWGCERTRDSSLPPTAAVEKLAADRFYHLCHWLAALLLLLLLALPTWWAVTHWEQVQAWVAPRTQPPSAGAGQVSPEQQAPTEAEKAQQAANQAEAAAKKAQADADKASADAQRAQQAAEGTKADVDRKQKEAADALAAAKKAEDVAKQARAAADRAKAAALAAQKAAEQAKAAKSPLVPAPPQSPTGVSSSPGQPASSTPGASPLPSPGSGTGMPSPSGEMAPSAGTPAQAVAAPQGQIVLCDQGQPAADGTMAVMLEVRPLAGGTAPLPVQAWTYDGNTVPSRNRLQTNLKGGDHVIKATLVDSAGNPSEIQAVLTVQPGKVITTPGTVSLRPKTSP
jgi:cytoskeletal protein RodZ